MPAPELHPGEIYVWRLRLDETHFDWPAALPEELSLAARFRSPMLRYRYLRAHAALRGILRNFTAAPLEFAAAEHGKPYLPGVPELKFNLSHSHEMALVAVALEVDVGVDVERLRPMRDYQAVAERFFPPAEAAVLAAAPPAARKREFFRLWTRIEAMLKARGIGLYGAGTDLAGEWTVEPIDAGARFAAAVAATRAGMAVRLRDYGPRG